MIEKKWKRRRTPVIYQAPNSWAFDFTFKGLRHRHGGFFTKAQAEAALARLKTRLMDELVGLAKPETEDIPFETFARQVIDVHSKAYKKSWKNDEGNLRVLQRFFRAKALHQITAEEVASFMATRAAQVSNSTTNREMSFLKMVLNKAVEWGKIARNPAAKTKMLPEPPPVDRILTEEETPRLLAVAGPKLKPILITALGTGLRRGELFALKWKDIDFDRHVITVRMSKSGKSRKVPYGPTVAATLEALPHRSEFVFPGQKKGRPLQSISRTFHKACAEAQVETLRFHDLRHSYASGLIEAGVDIMTVSRILGHTNILTTQKYLHPTAESFRKAAEKGDALLAPNRRISV